MRGTLDLTLSSACRSLALCSRAWSGVLKIAVTTSPANKVFDRADRMGFLNGVIVAFLSIGCSPARQEIRSTTLRRALSRAYSQVTKLRIERE
jgi:hypothetical protein